MSSSSAWRPDCRLQPSRHERRARLAIILSTASALPASHAPWPVLLVATALTLLACVRLWRQPGTSQPVTALRSTPQGWRLTLTDGSVVFTEVCGPVRDSSWLLCLCLRERAEEVATGVRPRRWQLALWSDQLPAADWRRLRVSLRWRRRELMTPVPDWWARLRA